MRDIRIGNDFTIKWSLYKNDGETRTPYEVTGAAVLKLCSAYGTREVYGWQASGNTIVWTFRGADQRHLGPYQLVYIENEGTPNMMTVDSCDAFCLVSQSCQQSDPSELLMLESDIVFAEVRMIDDELSATSPNAISNRAVTEALGKKVDAVPGKGLSTEDFTTADKTKLQSLENYNDAGIREALNEKQDAIPDLETIREGAQKGATALQEHQDISHLATKQEVEDKLKKKADTEGSYPLMSVGYSADLLGRGESVPAEFSFRASGGKSIKDGTAWIKRLKGNSVVWNQIIGNNTFENGLHNWFAFNDASQISVAEDGSLLVESIADDKSLAFHYGTDLESNHKYLLYMDFKPSVAKRVGFHIGGQTVTYNVTSTNRQCALSIVTPSQNATYVVFYPILEGAVGDYANVYNVRGYDLTKMFGEGNEPTTIEEFYSRCPIGIDMNAYNEGEVIHMTAEGIKSVGDNAWDEEWESGIFAPDTGEPTLEEGIRSKNSIKVLPNENYWCSAQNDLFAHFYDAEGNLITNVYNGYLNYLPIKGKQFTTPANAATMTIYVVETTTYNHDIMITLVHSGWKQDTNAGYQPYWEDNLMFDQRIKDEFPDGMKKWDKVYNKNGKGYIVKGTGMVDMGELEWTQYDNGDSIRFSCDENYLPSIKKPNTVYESIVVCAKYASGIYEDWFLKDDVIAVTIFCNERIVVKDTSYTDAASFKAAMAGVPLYYELAEPTIIEYDEPFNLDYKVADFGTEQAIGSTPSAPISADIIYQFNAVDMIREHEIEINELKNLIAEMQTKLNSLS